MQIRPESKLARSAIQSRPDLQIAANGCAAEPGSTSVRGHGAVASYTYHQSISHI